nr:MAG TPA: hypothetical protein [Caudoviricetes sp.]
MSEQVNGQLTLYPVDSPASPFPWLESKKGKTTTVTSGLRCCGLSENCARIASSVRMYLESSRLPPGKWSRIWSAQAITSSCFIMKLRLSELGTGDRGCSSSESQMWQTPTAGQCGMTAVTSGRPPEKSTHLGAQVLIRSGLWPTPRANEYKDTLQSVPPSRLKDPGKCNLTQAIAMELMFATPCARDYRTGQRKRYDNPGRANNLNDQIGGQLNPTWCEWLMGFPIGWTDLNASETR